MALPARSPAFSALPPLLCHQPFTEIWSLLPSPQVSKRQLENMKACKGILNRLLTRVTKVRQVLVDILDDDQDMQDMYLARRAG